MRIIHNFFYNVTGNNWSFPIDKASAQIKYPRNINTQHITYESYLGKAGSSERNDINYLDSYGVVISETSRPLALSEGFKVNLTFPKSSFTAPESFYTKYLSFTSQKAKSIALAGFWAVLCYFIFSWFLVGKDPKKGEILLRPSAPHGISPALVRYITLMKYDDQVLTCALISMAEKGYLTIERKKE